MGISTLSARFQLGRVSILSLSSSASHLRQQVKFALEVFQIHSILYARMARFDRTQVLVQGSTCRLCHPLLVLEEFRNTGLGIVMVPEDVTESV